MAIAEPAFERHALRAEVDRLFARKRAAGLRRARAHSRLPGLRVLRLRHCRACRPREAGQCKDPGRRRLQPQGPCDARRTLRRRRHGRDRRREQGHLCRRRLAGLGDIPRRVDRHRAGQWQLGALRPGRGSLRHCGLRHAGDRARRGRHRGALPCGAPARLDQRVLDARVGDTSGRTPVGDTQPRRGIPLLRRLGAVLLHARQPLPRQIVGRARVACRFRRARAARADKHLGDAAQISGTMRCGGMATSPGRSSRRS